MVHEFIKKEIPASITDKGGAQVLLVNKRTIPLDTSIREARDASYMIGQEQLVKNNFIGLFTSMAQGVARDGHARQLGDFVTMYPVFKGEVDLDRGFDPKKNYVRLYMRLLNEMEVDITDWVFQDVTPGRLPFKLESVASGSKLGIVTIGEPVALNGRPLPVADRRVQWTVEGTDKAGEVPAAKVTGSITRIDLAADALAELDDPQYDGKTIVFTVRGNKAKASVSATLRHVAPPGPVLDTLTNLEGRSFTNTDTDGYLNGANLTGATVRAEYGTRLDPSSEELDWSYFSDAEFSYEVEDATKIRIHQLAGYEVSAYAYRYTVTTATGEVVKTFE